MVDVYQWRKYFQSEPSIEAFRHKLAKSIIHLIAVMAVDALLLFIMQFNNATVQILMITYTAVLSIYVVMVGLIYLDVRNSQAIKLLSEDALVSLGEAFSYFDKNSCVTQNLSEESRLHILMTKKKVPKRMYYDYITCCKEICFRLSLYKKANEKMPGTFSPEIDEMFKASKI